MIVTIDGPAGAGKSSVAKRLAKRLGFDFLDTGSMYRAVTWSLSAAKVDLEDSQAVTEALANIKISMRDGQVLVNGKDVTRFLRTPDISQQASIVAAIPAVRAELVNLQRAVAAQGNFVCEGRDQGTIVFPDSICKVFLTASPEVRAERRWLEMKTHTPGLQLEDVIAEQKIRDLRDETRKVGRLEKAKDATEIRVDKLSLDEVIDQIETLANAAQATLAAGNAQADSSG